MKCPNCGLTNLPEVMRCDCGYSFAENKPEEPKHEYRNPHYQQPPIAPTVPHERIVISDIDMPFGSMVKFMIKWSLASIPALIIISLIVAICISAFTALVAAL